MIYFEQRFDFILWPYNFYNTNLHRGNAHLHTCTVYLHTLSAIRLLQMGNRFFFTETTLYVSYVKTQRPGGGGGGEIIRVRLASPRRPLAAHARTKRVRFRNVPRTGPGGHREHDTVTDARNFPDN